MRIQKVPNLGGPFDEAKTANPSKLLKNRITKMRRLGQKQQANVITKQARGHFAGKS